MFIWELGGGSLNSRVNIWESFCPPCCLISVLCSPLGVFEQLVGQWDWEGAFKSPPEGARPESKVPIHSLWTGTESAQGPALLESSSHSSPIFAAFEVAKHPFPGTAILVPKCCSSGGLASFVSVSRCPRFSSVSLLSLSGGSGPRHRLALFSSVVLGVACHLCDLLPLIPERGPLKRRHSGVSLGLHVLVPEMPRAP